LKVCVKPDLVAALVTCFLFLTQPTLAKETITQPDADLEQPLEIAVALHGVEDSTLLKTLSPLFVVGRYERAISILKNCKNVMSESNLFLPLLIFTYATRDYDAVVSLCESWICANIARESSFDAVVYEFLGTAFSQKKQFSKAKEALNRSIELLARPRSLVARSKVNLELGNTAEATIDCVAVLKKWQKFDLSETLGAELDTQLFQGIWYPLLETPSGEDKEFCKVSQKTKSIISEAECLENSGLFEEAERLYAIASKNSDFDAAMCNAYGLCMATNSAGEDVQKDNDAAEGLAKKRAHDVEKLFEKGVALNKNDWRIWSNLGSLRIQLGDKVGGARALETAAKATEMPTSQRVLLGKMLQLQTTLDLLNKRFGSGSK
jgi:tetratricopeptide (TPR) repeat protein